MARRLVGVAIVSGCLAAGAFALATRDEATAVPDDLRPVLDESGNVGWYEGKNDDSTYYSQDAIDERQAQYDSTGTIPPRTVVMYDEHGNVIGSYGPSGTVAP